MGDLLAGKVAIVTGGGGGIGRGVSSASREGAAVVIAEVDAERARETQLAIAGEGGRPVAVCGGTCGKPGRRAIVTMARDEFGRIDVLVNYVGHFGGAARRSTSRPTKSGTTSTASTSDTCSRLRAVLPLLIDQGDGGSIVNVSTIEAFRAFPTHSVYSAYKSAITGSHAASPSSTASTGFVSTRSRPT